MANGKFISYLRVSTRDQQNSGLGLEAQRESVTRYLNGGSWELIQEVKETESGKRNDRPKLAEALRLCRLHGATLLVAKIDRLARNVKFIADLMDGQVKFVACDMPQANDMTIHILASVAQGEAKAISERTKAALAAAKARGVVLGGIRSNSASIGKLGNDASVKIRAKNAAIRSADLMPTIAALKESCGGSLRQIAGELNKMNIPTARGGKWSAVQVARVIAKAA